MNPADFRRQAPWALLLGCALALVSCVHEQLAGSSVTTGNPTEIQVSFTGEDGPMALTGRVEIFGATQIPVPGFRPEPLARYEVAGKQGFLLNPGHFAGIADSLWPAGSLEGDSLARFNLVITGEGQGAILRDLAFRIKDKEFAIKGDTAKVEIGLATLVDYTAVINPLDTTRLNFLFLKGTGFAALADTGHFRFKGLPQGNHMVSFLSVPGKQHITWPEDSAGVYGLNKPIGSGQVDTLTVTDLDFRLRMPDQYKP